jgi:hypothetical protein
MRTRIAAAAVALATPGAILLAALPAQAADDATVFVFHGVPEATVDVYVNDKLTLDDFKPGTLTDALALPAGTYSVKITDPADANTVIIGPADIPVEAGGNYTIAAYLGTDGKPTAKAFVNDVSNTEAGEGRLTVRHLANAPAVDITADGTAVFTGLANGQEQKGDVPADTYDVAVVAGGATVASADGFEVAEGANTIVYAWGDVAGGDPLQLAPQVISGLHSAPSGVPAGEAGLADDTAGLPAWALGLMAAAALGAAFSATRLVAARDRA